MKCEEDRRQETHDRIFNSFPSLEKLGEKRGKPPVLENMGGAKSGGATFALEASRALLACVNTVGVPPTDPQLERVAGGIIPPAISRFKTGEALPIFPLKFCTCVTSYLHIYQ